MLLLAGCGGNGGGVTTPPVDPPSPTMTAVDLAGLPAVTVPDGTSIAAGASQTFGDVTISCPAGGMACALSQDDDGDVTSTGGAATARLSQMAQDQMDAATMAMVTGLTTAIADPDGDGLPTGGLGVDVRPGDPDGANTLSMALVVEQGGVLKYDLNIDGDSTTVTAADLDELGKDDEAITGDNDAMEFAKSTESAAMLTGFDARVYERTMTDDDSGDVTKDVLRVYMDSKEAGDVDYFEYFDATIESTAPRPSIVSGITDATSDSDTTTPNGKYDADLTGDNLKNEGALAFNVRTGADAATSVSKDDAALFSAVPFNFSESSSQQTKQYAPAPTNPTERTFAGSFAGVPGTFVCGAATTCTTTGNAKGQLIGLSAGWTFRPTRAGAEGKVEGVKLDNDYLAYGYWLQTETKADGTITYGVNPFASGSLPFGNVVAADGTIDAAGVSTAVAALRGTAKYTGKATGMYAMKSFGTGAGVPTAAGQFTADASLEANFGGTSVPLKDHFTVSGSISNFRDTDGDEISGGGWNVSLMQGNFATAAPLDRTGDSIAYSEHTNAITGGVTTGGGSWTGMFYGKAAAAAADADVKGKTHPTGIAGEFNAHLGNGHVIGAFGATR